jgi:hypothetical protein
MPGLEMDKNPIQRALQKKVKHNKQTKISLIENNDYVKSTVSPVTGGPEALEKSMIPIEEEET